MAAGQQLRVAERRKPALSTKFSREPSCSLNVGSPGRSGPGAARASRSGEMFPFGRRWPTARSSSAVVPSAMCLDLIGNRPDNPRKGVHRVERRPEPTVSKARTGASFWAAMQSLTAIVGAAVNFGPAFKCHARSASGEQCIRGKGTRGARCVTHLEAVYAGPNPRSSHHSAARDFQHHDAVDRTAVAQRLCDADWCASAVTRG